MDNLQEDRILTAQEVADYLRVSLQWVYSHALSKRRPYLPSIKFGGARRFRLSALQEFIRQYEDAPPKK